MAALWTPVDFETGDTSQLSGVSGAFAASLSAAHAGSYGGRCSDLTTEGFGYRNISAVEVFTRFYMRIPSSIVLDQYDGLHFFTMWLLPGWGAPWFSMRRMGAGSGPPDRWHFTDSSEVTTGFSLDTWLKIEVRVKVNSATTSAYEMWVDNTLVYSDTDMDLSAFTSITRVQFGNMNWTGVNSGVLDFDDFAADDAQRVADVGGADMRKGYLWRSAYENL